jgi:hypothetical protein
MICTEKIDGSNGAIVFPEFDRDGNPLENDGDLMLVQSRKQFITPEKDNFGFARWATERQQELFEILGPGIHYGEWYGSGIQRGYGLQNGERRFMLFNVGRWRNYKGPWLEGLEYSTVLAEGMFDTSVIREQITRLRIDGSQHVPGYRNPEGVIAFHVAANFSFKATLVKDEEWKGKSA